MEENTFVVIDEAGNEKTYEVILTFKHDETNQSYVVYKDPEDESNEVFAARYNEELTDGGKLMQIETDDEWDMIEEVLNAFLDEE